MALRRQRLENFEFKATWSEFKATGLQGKVLGRKQGVWREREGGRQRFTQTGICLKSLRRGFGHTSAPSNLIELPDKE